MTLKADFSSRTRASAPTTGQHPDYQVNIQMAWKMHNKWKSSDSPEIWTNISDSEHNKKCLFTISFTPDKRAPMGKYSACVNMHQSNDSFMKECEAVRRSTLALFKRYTDQFHDMIPLWQEQDRLYIEQYNAGNDFRKTFSGMVNKMRSTQSQGIKC